MSVMQLVRCEQYEDCKQEFTVSSNFDALDVPNGWLILTYGKGGIKHFCSQLCLMHWFKVGEESIPRDAHEQLPCKARRFLLVDGETADITECVKWGGGEVTDECSMHLYKDWEEFKERNPGSGIQWIDQEVTE